MPAINALLRRIPIWAIYLAGAAIPVWLLALGLTGGLGPDPVKELEHRLGRHALQLLLAGLAVTPLLRFAGLNLMRFRRALGVVAFGYLSLHLLVWAVLDVQLDWPAIWKDIAERPYITVGMAGFALLLPLAATSNDSSLRRMGAAAWRRLHRLVYIAVPLGALHYVMSAKTWELEPILYLAAAAGLVALRLPILARARRSAPGATR